jgi:uncharacterized membrane protein YkvA (DUF1232 family)
LNTFFYNTPSFFKAQKLTNGLHYAEFSADGNTVLAHFHLFVKEKAGLSPLQAPFGSIEFDESLGEAGLDLFIKKILTDAKARSLEKICITSYPDCYQYDKSLLLQRVLLSNGFRIRYSDLNYHFPVTSELEFKQLLHRGERWKLNRCKREGLEFHQVEMPDLNQWFTFIKNSRERKNYPISLTRHDFVHQIQANPDRYRFFGVFDDARIVALAVTVVVNKDIIYTFYTADLLEYRKWSPVVMLHEGIYQHCQQHNIKLLDLGTSSKYGVINEGVSVFKSSMGAIPCFKHTFECQLTD